MSGNTSSSSSSSRIRRSDNIASRLRRASTSSRSGGACSSRIEGSSRITGHAKCTICSERYKLADRIYAGSCGHVFHWQCLQRWWEESNRCPICRSNRQDFHQIYLDFEDAEEQSSAARQGSTPGRNQECEQNEFATLLYEADLYRDEIDYLNTRIDMYNYEIQHLNASLNQITLSDSD